MQPPDAGVAENSDDKPWMRPWHPKEIRENAHHWNLAADAGLLRYLGDVSMNFMQRAQESTQGINSLAHDTSMADVRVRNVTDRFMTLSDSQFIENRVYDEDVSTEAVEDGSEKNKDDTEGDIDPFPKLKTAIQMGLQVLEESFDVLDPNAANSDFDSDLDSDDDDQDGDKVGEKIYEPKDPYVARPLPYLIGSRGFQESDDVGIRDLPSDDEVVQDDQGSISESDEDIEKLSDRKDSVSSSSTDVSDSDLSSSDLSDTEQKPVQVATKFSSSSDSEDGDLFGESDSEDEPKVIEQKSRTKSKASHKAKPPSKSRAASKAPATSNDLFGSEDDDDGSDLFGDSGGLFGNAPNLFDKKKKTSGLFDGADISDEEEFGKDSPNSFDDESQKLSSDGDDDIPDHKEEEAMSEKSSKPSGGIALFGGALTKELLSKTRRDSSTSRSESMSQVSGRSSVKKSSDLFAGEDSDEDDLFSSEPKTKPKQKTKSVLMESDEEKPPPVKKTSPKKKTVSDLFGDDSDEDDMLFGDAPSKPMEKKLTAKPPLSKKQIAKPVTKQKPAIFDSESSDDDSIFSKKPPPMKPKATQKTMSKDLFDSDSEDDFFADKMPATTKHAKTLLESDSGDDLFADNAGTNSKLSNTVVKSPMKAEKSSLFQDSDEDLPTGDLKNGKSSSFKQESVSADVSTKPLKKEDDLFGDDSEDDQNEPSPPPVKKKPAGAVSMFGGGFGGGELSAAILKRRGVSDVSTSSSSNNATEADKPAEKPHDSAPTDKKLKEGLPEKPVLGSANISIPPKELSLNSTPKPFKSVARPSPMKPSSSVTSPQSSVGSLRSTLTINPASLLPGAAPKPKPVVKTEISFDKPPDVKTLDSVNKTRARGQKNRRPPTRHARGKSTPKNPVTPALPNYSEMKNEATDTIDSVQEEKPTTPSMVETKPTTESVDKIQPTAQSNDNLFDDFSKDPKPHQKLLDSTDLDDELFSSSLFAKTKKKDTKSQAPKLFNDDIFGDDDDFLTSLTSKKPTTLNSVKTATDGADDNDDIFGDLSIGNILGKKEKKTAEKTGADIFDDDIFNDKLVSKVSSESNISKDKSKSSDEPDLFSETSNVKSKTQSSKTGLFDDDDDEDIFGEKTAASKPKQNRSSNDDNDIFGDVAPTIQKTKSTKSGDDIFGDDIFSSKPSSKKKVKQSKPTKKTATASIFDDEQDLGDIFVSSSAKKKSAKSTSAKKPSKSKEQESTTSNSSVIDDPLSMP